MTTVNATASAISNRYSRRNKIKIKEIEPEEASKNNSGSKLSELIEHARITVENEETSKSQKENRETRSQKEKSKLGEAE